MQVNPDKTELAAAIQTASEWVAGNLLVIDTESTDMNWLAQKIGTSSDGKPLFETDEKAIVRYVKKEPFDQYLERLTTAESKQITRWVDAAAKGGFQRAVGIFDLVQIAGIRLDGSGSFDHLLYPAHEISPEAIKVHKKSWKAIVDSGRAVYWSGIYPELYNKLRNATVIAYNSFFDSRGVAHANRIHGMAQFRGLKWVCAMHLYSQFRGEPGKYGGYRWIGLSEAISQCGLKQDAAHDAMGDVSMTAALVNFMASYQG